MYKHSTTHRTLSRRLAALLAALALLAAMALPVYAEALDGATQMQETVETDNNGETDNKVEAGSDVKTDDKSETKEDTGTGAESEDTNDDASSSTTGDSNTTADDAVNDTPQTLPADEAESAGRCPRNSIALHICNSYDSVVKSRLDMNLSLFNVLSFTTTTNSSLLLSLSHCSHPPYFFLLAIVFTGPLRVLALVFVL